MQQEAQQKLQYAAHGLRPKPGCFRRRTYAQTSGQTRSCRQRIRRKWKRCVWHDSLWSGPTEQRPAAHIGGQTPLKTPTTTTRLHRAHSANLAQVVTTERNRAVSNQVSGSPTTYLQLSYLPGCQEQTKTRQPRGHPGRPPGPGSHQ